MKMPAILAFIWLVFKVVMLQVGMNEDKYGLMLNLFFIVMIIFLAIRKTRGESDFLTMVKTAMRPAAFYVVCVAVAIFIYYQFLDPGYLSGALDRVIGDERAHIESVGGFEAFKASNPEVKVESLEAHLQLIKETYGGFISLFSPYGRASIALITLTFFGLFYTLFMVAVHLLALKFIKK